MTNLVLGTVALALLLINAIVYKVYAYAPKLSFKNSKSVQNFMVRHFAVLHLKNSDFAKKFQNGVDYIKYFSTNPVAPLDSDNPLTKTGEKLDDAIVNKSLVFFGEKEETHEWPFRDMVGFFLSNFNQITANYLMAMHIAYLAYLFLMVLLCGLAAIAALFKQTNSFIAWPYVLMIIDIVGISCLIFSVVFLCNNRHKLQKHAQKTTALLLNNMFALPEIKTLLDSLNTADDFKNSAIKHDYEVKAEFKQMIHGLQTLLNHLIIVDNIYLMNAKLHNLTPAPTYDKFKLALTKMDNRRAFITLSNELKDTDLLNKLFVKSDDEANSLAPDDAGIIKQMQKDCDAIKSIVYEQLAFELNQADELKREIVLNAGKTARNDLLQYYRSFAAAGHYLVGEKATD